MAELESHNGEPYERIVNDYIENSQLYPLEEAARTYATPTEVPVQCRTALGSFVVIHLQQVLAFQDGDVGFHKSVVVHKGTSARLTTVIAVAENGILVFACDFDLYGFAEAG